MNKKILIGLTISVLSFSGCSTNFFGVGYENSVCTSAKGNGFCGAPSSIYKYKSKIKQMQSDYKNSGYPNQLFFSISRKGVIGVKEKRDKDFINYRGSRYEREINKLLKLKYKTNLGTRTSSSMDVPVGENNDLSLKYAKSQKYIQTKTNVGRMIRDNGEYSRTWVAPYVDKKGDLISAHEIYSVVKDPKWVIGEKTPRKVIEASTPTPMSSKAYSVKDYKRTKRIYRKKKIPKSKNKILKDFLAGD